MTLARGKNGCPIIHKNVTIGAYTFIIGNVKIHENTVIGARTMVLQDIDKPDICVNQRNLKNLCED